MQCSSCPCLPLPLLRQPTPMWIKQMPQLLFLVPVSILPTPSLPSHPIAFAPYFLVVSTKCCFISLRRYLRSGVLCVRYWPRCPWQPQVARANKLKLTYATSATSPAPAPLPLVPPHNIKAIWHWPRAINNDHHEVLTSRSHTYSPASTATKSV